MEANWLSRPLSSIPSFDQISLVTKDCRNALTTICKKAAEKLVRENASLKESHNPGCFLTLNNEADRLCEWIATLNNADLLKVALKTVIKQSKHTEMKTDDKIAASFAQHATLSLLLLAAYLEQVGQQFGLDDASRLNRAMSLAKSVLPDSVSGQTIIEMLSGSELAPSRPVDGFDLEEIVHGVTAAVDCLSSWTTVLELYQCEKDMPWLGDELGKPMANDETTPRKPLLVPCSPSAKQKQPAYLTTEVKPSKKSKDENTVKRRIHTLKDLKARSNTRRTSQSITK